MRKFFGSMGSVTRVIIESQALKSNMLGDPSARAVDVYVPAGHDGQGLPLLVDLVGFTSSGLSHTNWVGFRENLPERLDRLIGEQRMPPVVAAFPDCFTRLGGNQYINSASTGAWEHFLLQEMLPAIEATLRVWRCRAPRRVHERALAGMARSRTRYATLISGRRRPVIPAIWASSCATCPICQRSCAPSPALTIPSSAGGSSSK
jgi:enterochelin esterase-like enzyme